jgi:hypothetical protein
MKYKVGDKVVLLGTKQGITDDNDYRTFFLNQGRHKGDVETISMVITGNNCSGGGNQEFFLDKKPGRFYPCDIQPYSQDWKEIIGGDTGDNTKLDG